MRKNETKVIKDTDQTRKPSIIRLYEAWKELTGEDLLPEEWQK